MRIDTPHRVIHMRLLSLAALLLCCSVAHGAPAAPHSCSTRITAGATGVLRFEVQTIAWDGARATGETNTTTPPALWDCSLSAGNVCNAPQHTRHHLSTPGIPSVCRCTLQQRPRRQHHHAHCPACTARYASARQSQHMHAPPQTSMRRAPCGSASPNRAPTLRAATPPGPSPSSKTPLTWTVRHFDTFLYVRIEGYVQA